MAHLHNLLNNRTNLIIFDKDGTLIDFHAMWATWLTDLAQRLELNIENEESKQTLLQFSMLNSQCSISRRLFQAMDFNFTTGRALASGRLAVEPIARLRELTVGVLREAGLSADVAERVVEETWRAPDPVALARPLADLPALFPA